MNIPRTFIEKNEIQVTKTYVSGSSKVLARYAYKHAWKLTMKNKEPIIVESQAAVRNFIKTEYINSLGGATNESKI